MSALQMSGLEIARWRSSSHPKRCQHIGTSRTSTSVAAVWPLLELHVVFFFFYGSLFDMRRSLELSGA